MNHVFGDVAARVLPKKAPVDESVGIEFTLRPSVLERIPADIRCSAVRGHRPHPLSLAMRRVAAHPRFYVRDLADDPLADPLLRISERSRTLVLQPNLDHLFRFLCRV